MKLSNTNTSALTLPPGKTDHFVWCDKQPGFGYRLRMGAGGKVGRTWICQYRVHGGATRRMTLGTAEVVSADQARALAKKTLGDVAHGKDPQRDKQSLRDKDRHSFEVTVADYLAIKQRESRARSHAERSRYLTGYFKPLHRMGLDTITRKDVAAQLTRIGLESGSTVAAAARSQISGLFTWALTQGLIEQNPVIGTLKPKPGPARERVLTDDELRRIWKACDDDDYGRCIRLLILSGCRRQEIGGMCWSEIDLRQGLWTLPAARSKNNRAHQLPLMPAMLDIIKRVPRLASRDQLFGTRGDGLTAWSRGKAALDERADLEEAWTTHDIRRTVATRMADLGIAPHVIERILNHQSGHRSGVAGVYNRSSYEREVKSALATWHDHIRTLTVGGKRKVISLPRTAS